MGLNETSRSVSLWALLKDAYLHGGIAINPYRFVSLARAPGQFMEKATTTSHPFVDVATLAIIGYGAGKLLLLNLMRTYYLWWPLHPVAYPIATGSTNSGVHRRVYPYRSRITSRVVPDLPGRSRSTNAHVKS